MTSWITHHPKLHLKCCKSQVTATSLNLEYCNESNYSNKIKYFILAFEFNDTLINDFSRKGGVRTISGIV